MAATPSIKITKQSSWRGGTRLWSNRYHFNGGTPASTGDWTTFADAVVDAEKLQYSADVEIVQADGYAAGSDVPVFTKAYATVGTRDYSAGYAQELQVAALVRFETTARTSKNHPVYLFNYVHNVFGQVNDSSGLLKATEKGFIETYAAAWITGFSDGTNTYVRAGPNGATATVRVVDAYMTHRDFPT